MTSLLYLNRINFSLLAIMMEICMKSNGLLCLVKGVHLPVLRELNAVIFMTSNEYLLRRNEKNWNLIF